MPETLQVDLAVQTGGTALGHETVMSIPDLTAPVGTPGRELDLGPPAPVDAPQLTTYPGTESNPAPIHELLLAPSNPGREVVVNRPVVSSLGAAVLSGALIPGDRDPAANRSGIIRSS